MTIHPHSRQALFVGVLLALASCGSKKPEPAPQPAPEPTGSAAAPDAACKAAGGVCMSMLAAVECNNKLEAACPQDSYCCRQ
jgi:hypothetical protein